MKKLIITFTIFFLLPFGKVGMGILLAQTPGSLDLSFDTDGKQTTDFGSPVECGFSIAIQLDGKIIVAGTLQNDTSNDFALVRYNSNGNLDNTFDGDGKLTTNFGSSTDVGYSVVLQLDGKIVVAGYSNNGVDQDFALARYNSNGSLDNSFDGDGKLTTDFGSPVDIGCSVAIQEDGKIVVAGYSYNGVNYDFALARFNSDGSLDNSFDGDGKLTTDLGFGDDRGSSVAIQSDGKIVVAGYASNGSNNDFALARYNSNGSLDNSFDSDGKLTTDFTSSNDYGHSVVVRSDEKIILAGCSGIFSNNDFALAQYNINGSLDTNFSSDGKLTTDFGNTYDNSYSVAIESDGKIVLVGNSYNLGNKSFALARYNNNGGLDTTLDSDGKLTTGFGGDAGGFSVAIQSDGKIVVAGFSNTDFAIARYISGLNVGIIDFSVDNNSVLIYPNPIAQEAKLEYILNTQENISISLMDMQGKMVKTFVNNEKQEPGSHTQILAMPEGLASGPYYIVISTPRAKVSVKVIK